MTQETKKIIILSSIALVLFSMLVVVLTVDIPLLGVYSVKTALQKSEEIEIKEAELVSEQVTYNNLKNTLESAKNSYSKEKTKYEAISEETINIIKESNTEENYSLEYMWIKLGNYAKRNNLSLVIAEPGNTYEVPSEDSSSTTTEDASVVEKTDNTPTTNSNNGVLKIQVTGSYIDLSDFIFEVENDKELKFKLDNISMEYVSGTTIKTTFDVKNIVITK